MPISENKKFDKKVKKFKNFTKRTPMFHAKKDARKSDECRENLDKSEWKQPEAPFQLLNADGTPLNLNLSDSESEENAKVAAGIANREIKKGGAKEILEEHKSSSQEVVSEKENSSNLGQYTSDKEGSSKESNDFKGERSETVEVDNNAFDDIVCEHIINGLDEKGFSEMIYKDCDELTDMSDFIKYLQLEDLIRSYPLLTASSVSSRIQKILYCRERRTVPFSLLTKNNRDLSANAKIKALKEKKENTIEKARNELNRVTETNVQEVIAALLALKVEKISEMKEIAACFFEKCVKEKLYQGVYIQIIASLKKAWRCIEEAQYTDKSQTCFFGTILTLVMNQLTTRQDWANSFQVPQNLDAVQAEQFIEDAEAERLKLKGNYIGAVNLIVKLYTLNVIGPSNVIALIEHLTLEATAENIESLVIVAVSLSLKFIQNEKQHIVKKMEKYFLFSRPTASLRIKFMIEKALEVIASAFAATSDNTSVFASMCDDESIFDQPPKTPFEVANEYMLKISAEVNFDIEKNDNSDLQSQVSKYLANCDNDSFFLAFFIESISNYRKFDAFRDLFISSLHPLVKNIGKILLELKAELPMLEMDFPCTAQKYAELLCYLRASNIINNSFFKSLQNKNFNKLIDHLSNELKIILD